MKTYKFRMTIILIVVIMLSGCAGTSDWSYELPNNYEVWRINSDGIIIKNLNTQNNVDKISGFIKEFSYDTRYVFTRNVESIIYIDKNTKWNSIKFNKGANIKILGCNAGGMAGQKNMVTEVNKDSDGNFESYTGAIIKFKSIAQIIANKTNTTVWAYTNYTSKKQIGHGYYQTPVNMYGEGEMNFKYMTGMWLWKKEQEMAGTVNNALTIFDRQ